tara:strand:+ start:687 stop:1262 length:576 start_codon:yes stop_codon:yes gene_type:complete
MKLNMIVACCVNNGIGYQNGIPWFIRNDLKYFSKTTKGQTKKGNKNNAIIMGRRTWESLPKKPLPQRHNIVLSRSVEIDKIIKNSSSGNTSCFQSSKQAIYFCKQQDFDEVWIIGGTEIYKHFYEEYTDDINYICVTRVNKEYICDVYFPEISEKFTMTNCFLTTEYDEATKENIEVEYQTYTPYKHYSKS